ncbi:glycosyltransferase family 2 protein, partial [Bacteroides caccae]
DTQSCLAEYRIRKSSLSSNKIKVLPWVWNIYMNIEKLGYFRSAFYFINYAFRGIF